MGKKRKHYRSRGTPIGVVLQPERWWRAAVLVWLEIHANLGNRIVLRRKSGATTLISLQLVDPSAESAPWNA